MKRTVLGTALIIISSASFVGYAASHSDIIPKEQAIEAALAAVNVEVLGIRHDEPDTQWDVFVKKDEKAYEIEVNANTGEIVAVEEETLEEIQAELSGDLSHEGTIGDVDK